MVTINSDADLSEFREEVEQFVNDNYPKRLKVKTDQGLRFEREDFLEWQCTLNSKGWGAPNWPIEFGGTDWSIAKRRVFESTLAFQGTLGLLPFGTKMIGPVLIKFGTSQQKSRFLSNIRSGTDWWCQGYSETGAGSDLANLQTRAQRVGNDYIVNGAKTWTSFAQWANWMFCLVRTGSFNKKQEGISFLLIDMNTPGITVKPIITVDGVHEVNEVFFDDVRVPIENLVGEEHKGWTYAKYLLTHERVGTADVARSLVAIERLKSKCDGQSSIDPYTDSAPIERAMLEIRLMVLQHTEDRFFQSTDDMDHLSVIGPSMLKILGSELQQSISEASMQSIAYRAMDVQPPTNEDGRSVYPFGPSYSIQSTEEYINLRKATIYGGSTEVQKNIIAKKILGL